MALAQGTRPGSTGLVPAQLGFLAIFNPSLGNTDETVDDQIVYYASPTTQRDASKTRRARASGRPTSNISHEERNERLRQIGLAQGMAEFSRGFADGASVDTIETEKSRVVLHELEPGWWILASVDLIRVPLPPRLPTKGSEAQDEKYEYSSRDMKPTSLLLQDLIRAHGIFLLHHDSSLSALFVRTRRSKFVAVLSRYWDLYLSTWNVMLQGNPTKDMFGAINVAASGELGVGVGEEDRGSGEREVLESLPGRIEGLVDVVVSRFGDADPEVDAPAADSDLKQQPWLGSGQLPRAEDGAIFLGNGALSHRSLRDITHWMEDLYIWGDHAYGVIDSPTSMRRRKAKSSSKTDAQQVSDEPPATAPGRGTEMGPTADQPRTDCGSTDAPAPQADEEGKLDKMVGYLKLGYGSYWTLPGTFLGGADGAPETSGNTAVAAKDDTDKAPPTRPKMTSRGSSFDAAGHFMIGLKGEMEEAGSEHEMTSESDDHEATHNSRTVLRTVNVEMEIEDRPEGTIVRDFAHPASALVQSQVVGSMTPGYDSHDLNKARKVRVVVYVNKPFMFTFLFNLRTDSLAWDALYRSLHYQLAPLKKPLLSSTGYRPERPSAGSSAADIHDLVWDPVALTVHSTIPNIPEHYEPADTWSRADALNTHAHLLNIFSATRGGTEDLERTQKTSRGWWIVWTRLLDNAADSRKPGALSTIRESGSEAGGSQPSGRSSRRSSGEDEDEDEDEVATSKEVMLIRRASDHVGFRSEGGEGVGKVAQGIGIDTRRYIEELLSLL